jgi:hypothetical protein
MTEYSSRILLKDFFNNIRRKRSFSQSVDRSGAGVSLSGIDLKVGKSTKRRTRRCFRLEDPSEWAGAGKGRADARGDSEAGLSDMIGSLADKRPPPRA